MPQTALLRSELMPAVESMSAQAGGMGEFRIGFRQSWVSDQTKIDTDQCQPEESGSVLRSQLQQKVKLHA